MTKFPAPAKLEIHIVDSGTYSLAYGWPTMQAAKMAKSGKSVEEILLWLEDYFSSVEIYLGCYTLEYAKKSGRISAAAAFVGDVLGLRPIIAMIGGGTKVVDKVRGEKNVAPRLLQAYLDNCADPRHRRWWFAARSPNTVRSWRRPFKARPGCPSLLCIGREPVLSPTQGPVCWP